MGVGAALKRRVFINGRPEQIGYLSNLRITPTARGTAALARGYRFFRKVHDESLNLPFYLTTIMDGNETAAQVLTSGRAGLPEYRELGGYRTILIPAIRGRRPFRAQGCRIRSGSEVGAVAVLEALSRLGRRRQFFPVTEDRDFGVGPTAFSGMWLEEILVAIRGGEIVGTLGLWDQSAYRQIAVSHYGPLFRLLRGLASVAGPVFGGQPLPRCGEPVSIALGACMTCEGNDPVLFRALLSRALILLRERGIRWLALGFSAEDPLGEVAGAFFHFTIKSRIFRVAWPSPSDSEIELDGRLRYLELGSL